MLENLDFELVYKKLGESSYVDCCFYAERTSILEAAIHDKEIDSRHSESGGLLIKAKKTHEGPISTFKTNRYTTDEVLRLLGLGGPMKPFSLPAPQTLATRGLIGKRLQNLQQLMRKINLENSLVIPSTLHYREVHQTFQSLQAPGAIKEGNHQQGELKLEINASFKGRPSRFSQQISGTSLEDLWIQVQNLVEEVQKRIRMGASEQWPAPKGELPIGWSSQSLAKLAQCFIRGFEGDMVLKNFSYLSHIDLPIDCLFTLHEKETIPSTQIDHEGALRKAIMIFDGNQPRSLATDQRAAEEFSVASTGHSRRESFESSSTVGFWHPVLTGKTQVNSILSLMTEGIWVEELEIQELDLIQGKVTLYLSQANLVHQGEIGESIQPFSWTVSLVELMSSLKHFSKDSSTTGLFHQKLKQRILTEYTTPSALSLGVEIPGSVPKDHYW